MSWHLWNCSIYHDQFAVLKWQTRDNYNFLVQISNGTPSTLSIMVSKLMYSARNTYSHKFQHFRRFIHKPIYYITCVVLSWFCVYSKKAIAMIFWHYSHIEMLTFLLGNYIYIPLDGTHRHYWTTLLYFWRNSILKRCKIGQLHVCILSFNRNHVVSFSLRWIFSPKTCVTKDASSSQFQYQWSGNRIILKESSNSAIDVTW